MLLFGRNCPNCHTYYDATLIECPNCHKNNELYARGEIANEIVFLHPAAQLGLFLGGFAYAGMIICEFIAAFFCLSVKDEILTNSLIVFFAYLLMCGGLLSIPLLTRRKTFFKKFTRPLDYAYGAGYAGLILVSELVITLFITIFNPNPFVNGNQQDVIKYITNYPILMFFALCLLGPICEEMTYRVGLHSFFRRINRALAFIVTAFIFAFVHFRFNYDNITGELLALPSYLMAGIILAFAYEHRGPACSITAHILFNLTAYLTILMA